jgi:hypothetical protein
VPIPLLLKKIVANINFAEKINSIDDEISNKMVQFDSVIEKAIKTKQSFNNCSHKSMISSFYQTRQRQRQFYKVLSNLTNLLSANFIENEINSIRLE